MNHSDYNELPLDVLKEQFKGWNRVYVLIFIVLVGWFVWFPGACNNQSRTVTTVITTIDGEAVEQMIDVKKEYKDR